jgi:DNA mismatch repair protein MutS2
MIYPNNAGEKLGFLDIKELIKLYCLSPMGRQMVDKIQVMNNFDNINKFLRQTNEFKSIIQNDSPLTIQNFFDIKSMVEKARIEGTYLSEDEFFKVSASLTTVFAIIQYFSDREGHYPNLEALFEHLPIEKSIIQKIEKIIDPKGKIKSNASTALMDLSSGISKAEQEARKKIDHIYKNAQNNGWTADGNLTIRDGRLCIPILSENKRKLKGFIHDESASGQTVYMEPEEVFQLNNLIRDLEFERKREIIKLLIALTDELRPYVPLLLSYYGLLTKLDFVRAKALFAISIEGEMPILVRDSEINLINARHPLLLLSLKKENQSVVPLNIKIDEHDRVIVVSGPNAGGKSVCMKTVGLLQIMVQAGLLIPADEKSKLGIFKQIFADIGDDQSIESDLSTYSAHLSKMKYFIEFANSKTLILIDEFGTGTDPQFGGPIAESVLESLNRKNVRGVVTTHYSNLKTFANLTPGLENASMLFDNEKMQPLYILSLGKPGSSYAFEIAQKIGLGTDVIETAKRKVGTYQKKVDTLLVDLERDKKELIEAKRSVDQREERVKILIAENEQLKAYLDENKKSIIKDARIEAQNIIKNANKLIENTISEIRESKADKIKTQNLRQNLQQESKKHEVHEKKVVKIQEAVEIRSGDWVKFIDSETVGQVMEIARDNVILAMGDLRSVVKLNRVEKVSNRSVPKEIRKSHGTDLTESFSTFNTELDLRGRRGEEAIYEIEKYLDSAVMLGLSSLKIIHGKGDGILRKLLREYLRKYSQVSRIEDEHADRGGDGITYVYLK